VFYIGADQAEAANELTKVEGDIIQADAQRDTASATEKAAEKTFANYKRERTKSVASRLHLGSRKYEAPAFAKDYETWNADDRPALTDDELKAAEDTRRLDEPMPRLDSMSFDKTTIETAYRFIADVCGQSLATVALEEVQQYPDMLLWLKHGQEYHEAHGIADCLLCGNAISAERRALLAAALNDKVDQFVARLKKTAERLSDLIDTSTRLGAQLPAPDDLATELRSGFKEVRENVSKDVRLLAKQLGTLQTVLSAKLERPATPADMTHVPAQAEVLATAERLVARVATVNQAIAAHNQAVTDFAKLKEAAETSIRRHFIVDYRDDYAKTAREAMSTSMRSYARTRTSCSPAIRRDALSARPARRVQ
jgi:wobble nucleotide-excising tRNase